MRRFIVPAIIIGLPVVWNIINLIATYHTLPGDLQSFWVQYMSGLTTAGWVVLVANLILISWLFWPDILKRLGHGAKPKIDWVGLIEELKAAKGEHSKVDLAGC